MPLFFQVPPISQSEFLFVPAKTANGIACKTYYNSLHLHSRSSRGMSGLDKVDAHIYTVRDIGKSKPTPVEDSSYLVRYSLKVLCLLGKRFIK